MFWKVTNYVALTCFLTVSSVSPAFADEKVDEIQVFKDQLTYVDSPKDYCPYDRDVDDYTGVAAFLAMGVLGIGTMGFIIFPLIPIALYDAIVNGSKESEWRDKSWQAAINTCSKFKEESIERRVCKSLAYRANYYSLSSEDEDMKPVAKFPVDLNTSILNWENKEDGVTGISSLSLTKAQDSLRRIGFKSCLSDPIVSEAIALNTKAPLSQLVILWSEQIRQNGGVRFWKERPKVDDVPMVENDQSRFLGHVEEYQKLRNEGVLSENYVNKTEYFYQLEHAELIRHIAYRYGEIKYDLFDESPYVTFSELDYFTGSITFGAELSQEEAREMKAWAQAIKADMSQLPTRDNMKYSMMYLDMLWMFKAYDQHKRNYDLYVDYLINLADSVLAGHGKLSTVTALERMND
jgi:hypothetical protein